MEEDDPFNRDNELWRRITNEARERTREDRFGDDFELRHKDPYYQTDMVNENREPYDYDFGSVSSPPIFTAIGDFISNVRDTVTTTASSTTRDPSPPRQDFGSVGQVYANFTDFLSSTTSSIMNSIQQSVSRPAPPRRIPFLNTLNPAPIAQSLSIDDVRERSSGEMEGGQMVFDEPLYQPAMPEGPVEAEMNEIVEEAQEVIRRGTVLSQYKPIIPAEVRARAGFRFPVNYRIIDRVLLQPQHFFNAAIQYAPEESQGERTIPDVICHQFNLCMDTSHMTHESNGRFHTISQINETYLSPEALEEIREREGEALEEGEIVERARTIFSPMSVYFEVMTLHSNTFAKLKLSLNPRTHDLFVHAVAQGAELLRAHMRTGAIAGYDTALLDVKFDRFTLSVDSTVGYLAPGEGGARGVHFYPITIGPYPMSLFNEGGYAMQLENDHHTAVIEAKRNFFRINGRNSDSTDDDLPPGISEAEAIQRRVERMTMTLLPRAVLAPTRNTTTSDYLQKPILSSERPPSINHNPDTRSGWSDEPRTIPDEAIQSMGDMGCIINREHRLLKQVQRLTGLWSPPNEMSNNCFLHCLFESINTHDMTPVQNMRELYGITHLNHLTREDIQSIASQRDEVFHFYNIVKTEYHSSALKCKADKDDPQISAKISLVYTVESEQQSMGQRPVRHFLQHYEHCYLMKQPQFLTNKVKCGRCHEWLLSSSFSTHAKNCRYCPTCRITYRLANGHDCEKTVRRELPKERREKEQEHRDSVNTVCTNWLALPKAKKGKRITPDSNIFLADFEAFPGPDGKFTVYAVGAMCLEDYRNVEAVKLWYGPDAMLEYFAYLEKCNGRLVYFNGSKFDNFLHLREMVNAGLSISDRNFVRHSGRIISFEHHPNLKVQDLCLFIQNSLARGAKAWGVPEDMIKKDFDHTKIFSWESAEEHRVESLEYLKYDVLCLAHLYRIYHQTMWNCFSMDIATCISPAQYAINVWKAGNRYVEDIYIPHAGKEEDDDRAAYFGGRVMCQYKQYESTDWVDGLADYDYDSIEDYLVLGDVNSLYPAAQKENNFAYGKWTYKTQFSPLFIQALNENKLSSSTIIRSCFCVDVECPRDLITSFLMERASDGSILHNLEPKVKQWYWGCELQEAIILGYRVTRLYEVKEFAKYGPLFDEYVTKCWEGRKRSPKGTAQNLAFKFAMNSLTGKFGQRTFPTSSKIYSTDFRPSSHTQKQFNKMIQHVTDFTPLFSENGQNSAIILEVAAENQNPSYPIYLSGQILAYARVKMSQIMRTAGSYRDPARAIYYTDTDSLLLPSICIPPLVDEGYIGDELGQLKCDLNDKGRTGEFAKIIRGIWAATKGPYSVLYVLPNDQKKPLMEKVRVKGIPHIGESFKHYDEIRVVLTQPKERLFQQIQQWLRDPEHWDIPMGVIGERFYMIRMLDPAQPPPRDMSPKQRAAWEIEHSEHYFAKHINYEIIEQIMDNECVLFCYYGTMQKCFQSYNGDFLLVKPDVVRRMACKTDWWAPESRKRIYLQERASCWDLSFPVGYQR